MSGFRDLLLHVSEKRYTLPQIAKILDDEGLVFRGMLEASDFKMLKRQFPNELWPGRLECWAELETQNPAQFAGMYSFWCERA